LPALDLVGRVVGTAFGDDAVGADLGAVAREITVDLGVLSYAKK
jgi:hypothetical protein